jgi:hypothetical protein
MALQGGMTMDTRDTTGSASDQVFRPASTQPLQRGEKYRDPDAEKGDSSMPGKPLDHFEMAAKRVEKQIDRLTGFVERWQPEAFGSAGAPGEDSSVAAYGLGYCGQAERLRQALNRLDDIVSMVEHIG